MENKLSQQEYKRLVKNIEDRMKFFTADGFLLPSPKSLMMNHEYLDKVSRSVRLQQYCCRDWPWWQQQFHHFLVGVKGGLVHPYAL